MDGLPLPPLPLLHAVKNTTTYTQHNKKPILNLGRGGGGGGGGGGVGGGSKNI
jgi:hypothetical protein